MSNTTTQSNPDLRNVAKNEAPTTEKARARAHDAVDGAADRAGEVERKVRDEAAEAQVKLREKKAAATEQFEDSLSRLESFIQQRPMTAAGIAFAAGVLASRLMRS